MDVQEDDDYEQKLKEMQRYIPILETLIEKYKDRPQSKIFKLQNLYQTLKSSTNGSQSRKLKKETLDRCDDVLKRLVNKCDKGNKLQTKNLTNKSNDTQKTLTNERRPTASATIPTILVVDAEDEDGESSVHRNIDDTPLVLSDDDIQVIETEKNDDGIQVLRSDINSRKNVEESWDIPQVEPLADDECETWVRYDEEEGEILDNVHEEASITSTNKKDVDKEKKVRFQKNERSERTDRNERSDRNDRDRSDKNDRYNKDRSRDDRPFERSRDKLDKRDRHDRFDKRDSRYDRLDRSDRSERSDRYERPDRSDKYDRLDRHDRQDRSDKYDRHEWRGKEHQDNVWKPKLINDYLDVTVAAKSMADKMLQKQKQTTTPRSIPTIPVPLLEGSRRAYSNKSIESDSSYDSTSNAIEIGLKSKNIISSPIASSLSSVSSLLSPSQSILNNDKDPRSSLSSVPFIDNYLKKPPLSAEDVQKLLVETTDTITPNDKVDEQQMESPRIEKDLHKVNEEFKKMNTEAVNYKDIPGLEPVSGKPHDSSKEKSIENNIQAIISPNHYDRHPRHQTLETVDKPFYSRSINSNIIVIDSNTSEAPRIPPHNYGNIPATNNHNIPSIMNPNIAPIMSNSPINPDYGSPSSVGRSPVFQEYPNQQWNTNYVNAGPSHYSMAPNMIQDHWNRGPETQPVQPMPQPMPQPMQQPGISPSNEINRPYGNMNTMPRPIQTNAPYSQYMNYQQPQQQHEPPRPHWDPHNRIIRPCADVHGIRHGIDMRQRSEIPGMRPGVDNCSPRPLSGPSFTRANITYGQARQNDSRFPRDNRFSWDNRNNLERDPRNVGTRVPDRNMRFTDQDTHYVPEKETRTLSDRDPRSLSGRDPRLNRVVRPISPNETSSVTKVPQKDSITSKSAQKESNKSEKDGQKDISKTIIKDGSKSAQKDGSKLAQKDGSKSAQKDGSMSKTSSKDSSSKKSTQIDSKTLKKNTNKDKHISGKKGSKLTENKSKKLTGSSKNLSSVKKSTLSKRNTENETKPEKPKEVLHHSPLESLYGVVDASRTGPGYGIQKFKIPKIKRKEPTPPPPEEEEEEEEEEENNDNEEENEDEEEGRNEEEKDQPLQLFRGIEENWDEDDPIPSSFTMHGHESFLDDPKPVIDHKNNESEEQVTLPEHVTSSEPKSSESDVNKFLSEIQNLLLKGDDVKLPPELTEKLKDFIKKKKKKKNRKSSRSSSSSSSESDSSDRSKESEDEAVEKSSSRKKKKKKKVKRRMIISDSSEDEETIKSSNKSENKETTDASDNSEGLKNTEISSKQDADLKDDKVEVQNETEDAENDVEMKDLNEFNDKSDKSSNQLVETTESSQKDKRPKKRRNSLEQLHDDIRNMFICNDVITATGQRSCRAVKNVVDETSPSNDASSATKLDEDSKKSKRKANPRVKAKKPISKSVVYTSDSEKEEKSEVAKSSSPLEDQENLNSNTPMVSLVRLDMSKLFDTSKLNNSSSDESYGIDPPEASCAVDIRPSRTKSRTQKQIKESSKSKKQDSETTANLSSAEETDGSRASTPSISATSIDKLKDVNEDEDLPQMLLSLVRKAKINASDGSNKKKKKKNSSWQNGIIPKKKRITKKNSLTTLKLIKDDVEENDEENEEDPLKIKSDEGRVPTPPLPVPEEPTEAEVKKKSSGQCIKMGNKQMLEYIWVDQIKHKCLYCNFCGKNIVHHYSVQHPAQEVLISRLSVVQARNAIEQAKCIKIENDPDVTPGVIKAYNCRFCPHEIKCAVPALALENFYEHCTTHTGEYRFKCSFCPYRSINKGTVKSHYYKVCKKNSESSNVTEAVIEDQIPESDHLFGHICSKCNFVQLNKSRVEKHVKTWHSKDPDVKIIMINMSNYIKPDPAAKSLDTNQSTDVNLNVEVKTEEQDLFNEDEVDNLLDMIPNEDFKDGNEEGNLLTSEDTSRASPKQSPAKTRNAKSQVISRKSRTKSPTKTAVKSPSKSPNKGSNKSPSTRYRATGSAKTASKVKKKLSMKLCKADESKQECDETNKKENLSAFVCPPELEKHEEEIQLQRKKKMQEIVKNIGIKVNAENSPRRPSIIDKLKDKMETNLQDNEIVPMTEAVQTTKTVPTLNTNDKVKTEESKQDEPQLPVELSKIKRSLSSENMTAPTVKIEVDNLPEESEDITKTTLSDPLSGIEREIKTENERDFGDQDNLAYASDSSDDPADNLESTDVNSLLKESTNVNSSSNSLMMTTIQRLAASLQASKVPDVPKKVEETDAEKDISLNTVNKEDTIVKTTENKQPVPLKPLIRMRGDLFKDVVKSPPPPENASESCETFKKGIEDDEESNKNDPSNSIICRIENVVSLQDETNLAASEIRKTVELSPIKNTAVSVLKSPSVLKRLPPTNSFGIQVPAKTIKAINPVSKEPMKLIPITNIPPNFTNIVSVAQPTMTTYHINPKNITFTMTTNNRVPGNTTETISRPTMLTPIPQNNRPQLFTSIGNLTRTSKPVLTPITVASKAVLNTLPNRMTPVTTSGGSLKMLKVLNSTTESKSKITLKSAETYKAMLVLEKLQHLYKCMESTCSYSTNSVAQFQAHYQYHESIVLLEDLSITYGFQQCAYCCASFPKLPMLLKHFEDMHSYCNYLCRYCFYRAACISYVETHQKRTHPGKEKAIVMSKESVSLPPQGPIDRNSRVKPYICNEECNKFFFVPETFQAHLNLKHNFPNATFPCHYCKEQLSTPLDLIVHHREHNISKFQCLYCNFGATNLGEINVHLSEHHYNQRPIVLQRTLPQKPVKDKSAINQLLLLNLEQKSRQSISTVVSLSPDQTKRVYQGPLNRSVEASSSPTANNMDSAIIRPINLKGPSQKRKDVLRSTSPEHKRMKTDYVITRIPESVVQSFNLLSSINKDRVNVEEINEKEKVKTISAEDIKNKLPKDVATDVMKGVTNEVTEEFLRTEETLSDSDSDIEIIEDASVEAKKDNNLSNETTSELEKQKVEDKAQSDVNFQNENSNSSDCQSSIKDPISQPITMEDIKSTGLWGKNLFCCPFNECGERFDEAFEIKNHMKECSHGGNVTNFACPHCNKMLVKSGFYLEHLKLHGVKRFGCTMCKQRFAVQYQALQHMKVKHKVNCKLIPADPKNPSPDGLYIMTPVNFCVNKVKGKKKVGKSSDKDWSKSANIDKVSFGPNDINILPLQAIYSREVHCAVCPYTTKVRTNIIRHLQLHAKDGTVPESSPVNPVPCLDKREKMFDKMVNLASSSHQNGRMGGTKKDTATQNEEENLPKFVPENKRYVCGVPECSYLTVDEAMLRYHLKALHSDEPYFRCAHCSHQTGPEAQNITIDKMGVHLKMHDARLYKCSHCNYHHYHRYVVERHLSDKHPEKRPFVKVIREGELIESVDKVTNQEEVEDEQPDPDGNHWKCNMCDFKCVYKTEMTNHAANTHDEKCQFKCSGCSFKCVAKINIDQHLVNKHSTELEVSFTMVYQRIKGVKKVNDSTENVHEEPFDTTPLWRRDMPRIRHIRGILLEDEENTSSVESNVKKRKTESDSNQKVSKAKITKLESSIEDNKSLKDQILENTTNDEAGNSSKDEGLLVGEYGPYGKPIDNMYACTLCSTFKTKYKNDLRDHLYRELKYARWSCKECSYLSANKHSLVKHYNKNHPDQEPNTEALTPNNSIETWVMNVLKTQTNLLKEAKMAELFTSSNSSQSIADTASSKVEISLESDNENKDNNDTKFKLKASDKLTKSGSMEEVSLIFCKHCDMKFTAARGFKRHVMLSHLKCYAYLCPHCDRSAKTEALMIQHIRSKHPGMSEAVITNTEPAVVNDEFWLREYGLGPPVKKKFKKKKLYDSDEEIDRKETVGYPCNSCKYIAINLAGLKSHVKTHDKGTLKCAYCTYMTSHKIEISRHSELNHPNQTVKYEIRRVQAETEVNNEVITLQDYNNEIEEEEEEEDALKEDEEDIQTIYCCCYCTFCSISLESIRIHWSSEHKNQSPGSYKQFRCRKIEYNPQDPLRTFKCYYCSVKSTVPNLMIHVTQHHGNVPVNFIELEEGSQEGWFCVWCQEVCESRAKAKSHHRMFHSHLKPDFKKLPQRTFNCPECTYKTENLQNLRKHFARHINLIKCKYCEETFANSAESTLHCKSIHPDLDVRIESIQNYETHVSQLMLRAVQDCISEDATPSSGGVARKSTTKSTVQFFGSSTKSKSVARKSTAKSAICIQREYNSWYGKPVEPTDLAKINVQMTLAGRTIKVDCLTLSGWFNINPKIVLEDICKND